MPAVFSFSQYVSGTQRWVVERSFAWIEKCRHLWKKNCERKLNTRLPDCSSSTSASSFSYSKDREQALRKMVHFWLHPANPGQGLEQSFALGQQLPKNPSDERLLLPPVNLFTFIEAVGVFAFALSGLVEARQRDMDLVGLFVVALVAAFGGGTLRDLLLSRSPLFWIEHDGYAVAILGMSTIFALSPVLARLPTSVLLVADALGLGLFSVAGAGYALEAGCSLFIAALMGAITGTFGGVIRDVLCNELPSLFQQTPLYATCAFLGCYFYFLLAGLSLPDEVAAWTTILCITAFRLAAVRWRWVLPVSRH